MLEPYTVRAFWSEDDAGFVAEVAELLGCSAVGTTLQEALMELVDAVAARIQADQSAAKQESKR